MKKNDLSLILTIVGLAIPFGSTAVTVVVAFILGMLARPWVLSILQD